jgi:hypothetical protein
MHSSTPNLRILAVLPPTRTLLPVWRQTDRGPENWRRRRWKSNRPVVANLRITALVRDAGCIQQVDATLPKLNRFIQGGVYGTRETGGGFGGAANRHLAALEGGRVVA